MPRQVYSTPTPVPSAYQLLQAMTLEYYLPLLQMPPVSVLISHYYQGFIMWQRHYCKINFMVQQPKYINCHLFVVA